MPGSLDIFICILLLLGNISGDFPFRNTSLPWNVRVDNLASLFTLEEIMIQMGRGGSGPKASPAPAIKRLGIGPYSWDTECLRGDASAGNATSFPQALGLAASFSVETLCSVARATSIEVRGKYNDYRKRGMFGDHKGISCFSPVINIMRHPLWGRNQETYGEDPYLTGMMAQTFVRCLQGSNPTYIRASAGCKHFDVHGGPENIPESRFSFNAKVSERDWRLTFLPAFRKCVQAGTYSIMCSFNSINGIPACGNKHLLTDILRKEWGFKGYVISDQEAIENIMKYHNFTKNPIDTVALCVNAGCNLELSTNEINPTYFAMLDAIRDGKLNNQTVRDSVKSLFYTRMRLGEFDPYEDNPYNFLDLSFIQSRDHRNLSLRAAMKSFVLLKNMDDFLPVSILYNKISIIGPMCDNRQQQFGSYAPDLMPEFTTTPLEGLKKLSKTVHFTPGCNDNKCMNYNKTDIQEAVSDTELVFICLGTGGGLYIEVDLYINGTIGNSKNLSLRPGGLCIQVVAKAGQELESEGNDRSTMELPGQQLQLLKDAVQYSGTAKIVLLLFNAGPLNITWAENPRVTAILECFFPAQETGAAIYRVLTMKDRNSNPAGRLPFTWPSDASQIPSMTDYTMDGKTYRYFRGDPLYPFGYGLSYTTFDYKNAWLNPTIKAGQNQSIRVEVKNSGKFDGDEVIQVYLQWLSTGEKMPQLQLVSFERAFIQAGDVLNRVINIEAESMAVWQEAGRFVIEPGRYRLCIGGQQPNQKRRVPSNILIREFSVIGERYLH